MKLKSNLVSTAWLEERLGRDDIAIIDASWYLPAMNRNPEAEYAAGHIPGAVRFDIDTIRDETSSLPHMLPTPEAFAEAVSRLGIGSESTIVVYDGAGLFAAARVWWTFKVFGVAGVFVLDGGLPKWQAEGRPVSTEPASPKPRRFVAKFQPDMVADAGRISDALADGTTQVVDARPADRFTGRTPEPRPGLRSGHMPGSLNLPFPQVLDGPRLKEPEALRKVFADAGIDPARPVMTTCGSGVSAAVISLALAEAGAPAQALYDGSWAEWGGRADLPAEQD